MRFEPAGFGDMVTRTCAQEAAYARRLKNNEQGRCSGDCCRGFCLGSVTYEEIKADYEHHVATGEPCHYQDFETFFPLLIPLGLGVSPVREGGEGEVLPADLAPVMLYNCKALQPNGDCGIYETRPVTCRIFPSKGRCRTDGCTDARSLPVIP